MNSVSYLFGCILGLEIRILAVKAMTWSENCAEASSSICYDFSMIDFCSSSYPTLICISTPCL